MPAPYWTTYPEAIALAGGVPVEVATDEASGFRVTARPARAGPSPTARRRCCSCRPATPPAPSTRPTTSRPSAGGRSSAASGSSPTRSTSTSPTATTSSRRCPSLVPELAERCVVLNGVAKTYAMTGWRVGWMIGPNDVIAAATNLQSHATSNVANVSQRAALAAVQRRPRRRGRDARRLRPPGPQDARAARRPSPASPASSRRAPSTASRRSRACSGAPIGGRTAETHARAGRRGAVGGQGGLRAR